VEQTQYGKAPSCIWTKVGDQRAPIRPLVSDLGPKHSQTGSEEMGRIPAFAAVVGHEARDRAHTECADKPSQEGATASENRGWTDHATWVRAKTSLVGPLDRIPSLLVRPKACQLMEGHGPAPAIGRHKATMFEWSGKYDWGVISGFLRHARSSKHSAKGNSSTGPAPSIVFL
jgi:hypothetical protein